MSPRSSRERRFGLIVNPRIPEAVNFSFKVIDYLRDKVELVITQELAEHLGNKLNVENINKSPLEKFDSEDLELVITIGGDGTILRVLHNCNVKIFGINAGVVGFLTEVHLSDAVTSLERILKNDYSFHIILDSHMSHDTCCYPHNTLLSTHLGVENL